MFADLFSDRGRRSVPPSVLATVMVLQRLEGLSDRDAVERYTFDARWRYAAGVGGYDGTGWGRFAHTVLVDMRARLAKSDDPRRIFQVTLEAASAAGLVGAKRVLDSTPLYDAVATMDTITLIRSAVRGLLRVAGAGLAAQLRGVLSSGDDYASPGKPRIDWDDPAARQALVDSRARDGYACLTLLDGRRLGEEVGQASQLLATVLGQDLETTADGTFRIARRVAKDRVISTVDQQARHGHKTAARGFDGYKGHAAIDPDSEIITDTVVTPGNAGDASVAQDLIDDLVSAADEGTAGDGTSNDGPAEPHGEGASTACPAKPTVYGDNAYGTGEFHEYLADNDIDSRCKTQQPTAAGGMFTKADFDIDLGADTVTCPNGVTAPIRRNGDGDGTAAFGQACADCPLRARCTKADAERACAAPPKSTPTSTSSPPHTTSHAWPGSASAAPPPDGRWPPHERPARQPQRSTRPVATIHPWNTDPAGTPTPTAETTLTASLRPSGCPTTRTTTRTTTRSGGPGTRRITPAT